jgi:hypothetical protein
MQNAGAWRKLGECSSKCHLGMWSLGMPYLGDVPYMGIVKKFLTILNRCVKKVYYQMISLFVYLLSACNHAGFADEGMHCYASMIMVYTISANL